MKNFQSESIDALFEVILGLKTVEECYDFFEDVCTIKELQDMGQRLEVARLLSEGKNYQEIAAKTNVSTATISRVSKCLNYGSGGYKKAIESLGDNK
ncbi:MAG: helix-turn-helix domain-containing protein [Clostridia bacterium]|nr:helix-turn-helix domain-containing protein [Clostridia bacterium]